MKSRSELTLGTNAPVTSAAHMVTVTLTNPAPLVMHVAAAQNSDVTGLPIYSPITAPRTRTARRYATGRPNGRRPARRHALPPIAWGTRRSLGTVGTPGRSVGRWGAEMCPDAASSAPSRPFHGLVADARLPVGVPTHPRPGRCRRRTRSRRVPPASAFFGLLSGCGPRARTSARRAQTSLIVDSRHHDRHPRPCWPGLRPKPRTPRRKLHGIQPSVARDGRKATRITQGSRPRCGATRGGVGSAEPHRLAGGPSRGSGAGVEGAFD